MWASRIAKLVAHMATKDFQLVSNPVNVTENTNLSLKNLLAR
jgi:hypothetical protein